MKSLVRHQHLRCFPWFRSHFFCSSFDFQNQVAGAGGEALAPTIVLPSKCIELAMYKTPSRQWSPMVAKGHRWSNFKLRTPDLRTRYTIDDSSCSHLAMSAPEKSMVISWLEVLKFICSPPQSHIGRTAMPLTLSACHHANLHQGNS